jgi:hypothetical protein
MDDAAHGIEEVAVILLEKATEGRLGERGRVIRPLAPAGIAGLAQQDSKRGPSFTTLTDVLADMRQHGWNDQEPILADLQVFLKRTANELKGEWLFTRLKRRPDPPQRC